MSFRDYTLNPAANMSLGDGTYIGPNMLRNKVRPALQQLAADGKELADEVASKINLAVGPAGAVEISGVEIITIFQFMSASERVARVPGVTDDAPAWNAAVAYLKSLSPAGGTLFFPRKMGPYRINSKINHSVYVRIIGEGWGQNPGVVGATTYPFPANYYGSVVYVAPGVSAVAFHPFTMEENTQVVNIDPEGDGSYVKNPALFTEPSAYGSVIKDIAFVSLDNGAVIDAAVYGGRSRTQIHIDNVMFYGFRGAGFRIEANDAHHIDYGTAHGNANHSTIHRLRVEKNQAHGLEITGRDANNIDITDLDTRNNRGYGLRMFTILANNVINMHHDAGAGTGGIGAIQTVPGLSAEHVIVAPYMENGVCDLSDATILFGANGSSADRHPEASDAFVMSRGRAIRRGYQGFNNLGDVDVMAGIGRDPSKNNDNIALWWGSAEQSASMDQFTLRYSSTNKAWGVRYAGLSQVQFPTSAALWRGATPVYAPSFQFGLFLGQNGAGPRIFYGTSAPASGTWNQGDIVYNSAAVAGGIPGWTCVTPGTPGTWKAHAALAA